VHNEFLSHLYKELQEGEALARPVNEERRSQLLESAVDYAIDNGIAGLSLRPLAAALGVTPTTLVHHFGSKDQLLAAIINRVRERIMAGLDLPPGADADAGGLTRDAWAWMSDESRRELYRFFFELYGRALGDPERFAPFLERVVNDWVTVLTESGEQNGQDQAAARTQATLGLAVTRGLLLDLLTTGDESRVNAALDAFADSSVMATGERRGGVTSSASDE
jgi:AcrR family transcriptional regulator